jgi:hypothetical protein
MFDGSDPGEYCLKVVLWVGQQLPRWMVILSFLTFFVRKKLGERHLRDRRFPFYSNFNLSAEYQYSGVVSIKVIISI